MNAHPLDNPIWESLAGRHQAFATGDASARRYPPQVAPFLGVRVPDTDPSATLTPDVDTLLLLGPAPLAPPGWALEYFGELVQMVCDAPVPEVPGPDFIELGETHRADVLELTALVYPHYFRPRTMDLGRYFGIYDGGRLAAIIGERLGPPGFREISAVCTHPDFLGRGHARRLMAWLGNDLLASGLVPFLHVSPQNTRALELYERNGFAQRALIPFHALRRLTAG